MSDVSVCICTYKRPHGLHRLLGSLAQLDPTSPPREIIVVDNDAAGSAEPVIQRARAAGLDVRYEVEPRRGIAHARNRSVAPAQGEFVAFIDDDEEADPLWLAALHGEVIRRGADGGIGPVIPVFPPHAPRWLADGGFYDRPRPATGTVLRYHSCRTGNALVRRRLMAALPGPFDERFGLTGGEDTYFFGGLVTAGAIMIAVDHAIVREHLSANRARARWILWRRFILGASSVRSYGTVVRGEPREPWPQALRKAVRLGISGLVRLPASRVEGMRHLVESARHAGRVASHSGITFRPYSRDSWR